MALPCIICSACFCRDFWPLLAISCALSSVPGRQAEENGERRWRGGDTGELDSGSLALFRCTSEDRAEPGQMFASVTSVVHRRYSIIPMRVTSSTLVGNCSSFYVFVPAMHVMLLHKISLRRACAIVHLTQLEFEES